MRVFNWQIEVIGREELVSGRLRGMFEAKPAISDQPVHVALRRPEHERAAQYLAFTRRPTARGLATHAGVALPTAERYMHEPVLLGRAKTLAKQRLTGLVSGAISVLAGLLESDSERIRLDAAKEILDRTGVRGDVSASISAPFQVVLNFGGFKNGASDESPHHLEEISSGKSTLEDREGEDLEGDYVVEGEGEDDENS